MLLKDIWSTRVAVGFFVIFLIAFDLGQAWYYSGGGLKVFANRFQQEIKQTSSWSRLNVVMLDPEAKSRFYLKLAPNVKTYSIDADKREQQTEKSLLAAWPFLLNSNQQADKIFITRKRYAKLLAHILKNYSVIEVPPSYGERFNKVSYDELTVAFVPKKNEMS